MEPDGPNSSAEANAEVQYISLAEAGRLLGKDRETVRYHMQQGNLEARTVLDGNRTVYKINMHSLKAFAKERGIELRYRQESKGNSPEQSVPVDAAGELASTLRAELEPLLEGQGEAFASLARELGDARQRLGEESAKREAAEAEAERLRQELDEANAEGSRNRRGFWRRLFGG